MTAGGEAGNGVAPSCDNVSISGVESLGEDGMVRIPLEDA
ncbi:Unannotated [Lentimonas sp. CC19]|nr:Unannotated [Lentimonas sp. CC19]CAA6695227.1 Unannotated [Lentimonas sp. CC10]CAA7071955.1 Unannotated [Lentimonas sp. CC11]